VNNLKKTFLVTAIFALLFAAKQAQAIFILEKSVKNNIIRTGQINLTLSPEEGWLSTENLLPGQSISNNFSLNNTGSAPLTATISAKKSAGYTNLFSALIISIKHNEQLLYEGPASELQQAELVTNALESGQSQQFSISALLPIDATSTLDNTYTNLTFVIEAKQAG